MHYIQQNLILYASQSALGYPFKNTDMWLETENFGSVFSNLLPMKAYQLYFLFVDAS